MSRIGSGTVLATTRNAVEDDEEKDTPPEIFLVLQVGTRHDSSAAFLSLLYRL